MTRLYYDDDDDDDDDDVALVFHYFIIITGNLIIRLYGLTPVHTSYSFVLYLLFWSF
jgi:hypothetical protein